MYCRYGLMVIEEPLDSLLMDVQLVNVELQQSPGAAESRVTEMHTVFTE